MTNRARPRCRLASDEICLATGCARQGVTAPAKWANKMPSATVLRYSGNLQNCLPYVTSREERFDEAVGAYTFGGYALPRTSEAILDRQSPRPRTDEFTRVVAPQPCGTPYFCVSGDREMARSMTPPSRTSCTSPSCPPCRPSSPSSPTTLAFFKPFHLSSWPYACTANGDARLHFERDTSGAEGRGGDRGKHNDRIAYGSELSVE